MYLFSLQSLGHKYPSTWLAPVFLFPPSLKLDWSSSTGFRLLLVQRMFFAFRLIFNSYFFRFFKSPTQVLQNLKTFLINTNQPPRGMFYLTVLGQSVDGRWVPAGGYLPSAGPSSPAGCRGGWPQSSHTNLSSCHVFLSSSAKSKLYVPPNTNFVWTIFCLRHASSTAAMKKTLSQT